MADLHIYMVKFASAKTERISRQETDLLMHERVPVCVISRVYARCGPAYMRMLLTRSFI